MPRLHLERRRTARQSCCLAIDRQPSINWLDICARVWVPAALVAAHPPRIMLPKTHLKYHRFTFPPNRCPTVWPRRTHQFWIAARNRRRPRHAIKSPTKMALLILRQQSFRVVMQPRAIRRRQINRANGSCQNICGNSKRIETITIVQNVIVSNVL